MESKMRLTDKILICDLEATCWEENPPPNAESEIIEIGICILDLKTLSIEDNEGIIVKPEWSTVSEFCTKLTTLKQEDVDKGISLNDACQILRKKYNSKNRAWASYGEYDRRMFQRECELKNINYPFGSFHINVKGVVETMLGEQVGMDKALQKLNMPLEGTHHRGIDDARNIAKVYKLILEKLRK